MTNGIFSASRTATITVDEKNFDSADMIIKAVNSDGSAPQISGWSSYGNVHTATVSFNDDGIYTFSVEYTDMAGNKGNVTYSGEQPNSFTIDKTAPVVTVEYDNNDSENESYYNKPRTATITVNDKNISNEMLSDGIIIDGKAAGKIFHGLQPEKIPFHAKYHLLKTEFTALKFQFQTLPAIYQHQQ